MRFIALLAPLLTAPLSLAFAGDLQIVETQLACIEKQSEPMKRLSKYRYGVELIIKNTSEHALTLLTAINTVTFVPEPNRSHRVLSYAERKRGETVIIPPRESLELVELLPDDHALVSHQFSDKNFIEKASFEFVSEPVYGGRLHHWTGRLHSKEVETQVLSNCRP